MPAEIILQQSTASDMRKQLSRMGAILADRTAAFSAVRSELRLFEDRYFREAGTLYAELDALEARIAQREVDLYDSEAARLRAAAAREAADESSKAASNHQAEAVEFNPPASLRTLFREVAKRIHPDLARDSDEAQYFTLLMARANRAYRSGDTNALQRLRDDHGSPGAAETYDEVARLTQRIRQVRRDIADVQSEYDALLSSEIALLQTDFQIARMSGRDLVTELAVTLSKQIADAACRLDLIDRQITAHGR